MTRRILFSDGNDDRVLQAVAELARTGAARPTLLGEGAAIDARAAALGVSLEGVEVVAPTAIPDLPRHAERLASRAGIAPQVAARLLGRPVYAALADRRVEVVGRFRAAGGDLDRWRARDWALLADELTRLEDALEVVASRAAAALAQRRALRDARRQLEDALDGTPARRRAA